VHATVRARWDAGDGDTRALMAQVAALAAAGRRALEARDTQRLASLMDANFELRRGLFGDAALGAVNVAMVRTAQRCGAAAKFCGSGGAAVALCPEGAQQEAALQADCAAAGLRCERVRVRVHAPAAA
jgi:glucuronokinase